MSLPHVNRALLRGILPFVIGVVALASVGRLDAQVPPARTLPDEDRISLETKLRQLQQELRMHPTKVVADAAIFAKGLEWALEFDREFTPADEKLLEAAVTRCRERLAALQAGQPRWQSRRGKIALGYVSKVDGSVQPYSVVVPTNYAPPKPIRLDVVLHGSSKPIGMSELRFISRFDEGDAENPSPPEQPFIELHPLGRVENCYRWAGETDVFEAISDVCSRFTIDTNRIVLRGMSMGASGTWHLGLKHPDKFVALGPYCGYVDTHRFSETPLPTFVKVGPLPEHQELGLHMLDSIDYAANAGIVPVVAAMGEKDIFFDAHVLMGDAMKKEGLELINLISPGTGHVVDPLTHAEQMRRIAEHAERGLNWTPPSLRFVTWTLKYNDCRWLDILKLDRHYHRAELSARIVGDRIEVDEPKNVKRFSVSTLFMRKQPKAIRIGSTELSFPSKRPQVYHDWFERRGDKWVYELNAEDDTVHKRPGEQGPIDDAFTSPFVCVRGTGTPWNPAANAYAEASLQRFAREWRQYFRGELPIVNDTEVTADDVRNKNLILFGDPGSNSWIAQLQSHFPIGWTRESVRFGDHEYPATNHVPAFIIPNPKRVLGRHYVVVNSGHTFRGEDLGKLNYLLFPRWGDWAVLKIDPENPTPVPLTEEVLRAGYFDEEWQLPK